MVGVSAGSPNTCAPFVGSAEPGAGRAEPGQASTKALCKGPGFGPRRVEMDRLWGGGLTKLKQRRIS